MSDNFNRRQFLKFTAFSGASLAIAGCTEQSAVPTKSESRELPNFIIILCDDLGYGDIGCYGSKKHRTPHVDKMAAEGMRFTDFHVAASLCTPSRAALLTGCYPRRVNMHMDAEGQGVIFPVSKSGLNTSEITIPKLLKQKNYATACIGKWHLGDQPEFLPTQNGFDYYFGIPYSNDMGGGPEAAYKKFSHFPILPLMRNEKVIEAPAVQDTLTKRYTEESIKFIKANKNKPFFLYLPHSMPHFPQAASPAFKGKSANGIYGDAVEEIDWSTGQIFDILKDLGIDKKTMVIWTSDNGADYSFGGSSSPLSGLKASAMEGGFRVPCIMRWSERIPAGAVCDELVTTMDFLPTIAKLAGLEKPADRIIDGEDVWPLLAGQKDAKSPHEVFFPFLIRSVLAIFQNAGGSSHRENGVNLRISPWH